MYSKILVALDGSTLAESILNDIRDLALKLEAEVLLFRSVPGVIETMTGSHIELDVAEKSVAEDREAAAAYLESLASSLRSAGVKVRIHVGEGPPAATILGQCQRENIDLVAMTTHGRSGLKRTMFGSVADEVMRTSHLPVLVMRPGEGK